MRAVGGAITLSVILMTAGCGGLTGDESNTATENSTNGTGTTSGRTFAPQRSSIQYSNSTTVAGEDSVESKIFRLYQAAFNRKPDTDGHAHWVIQMKNGVTLEQVAIGFINSDEFKLLYGANPSTEQFVTLLYKNVLHRLPDESGFAHWAAALNGRTWNREQVLIGFSESRENKNNTQSETPTTTQSNSGSATSVPIKSGDSFTYIQTSISPAFTTTGTAAKPITITSYRTKEFQTVNSDSSHTYTITYSNASPGSTYSISADGSLISRSAIGSTQTDCRYSGKNAESTAPFTVGQTWDNSWTWSCNGSSATSVGTNKGSIVGVESVTVPAGTFSTYKEVFTRTAEGTSTNITKSVTNVTCWRDVLLLQNVKCESTTTDVATGATHIERQVLDSYIRNGLSSDVPWTSRFAGSWTVRYSGSSSGTCSIAITDSTTASTAILGNCSGANQPGTYQILGGMSAQGSAKFSPVASGSGIIPNFSAQFTSAASASGTWSLGQARGTWIAVHN